MQRKHEVSGVGVGRARGRTLLLCVHGFQPSRVTTVTVRIALHLERNQDGVSHIHPLPSGPTTATALVVRSPPRTYPLYCVRGAEVRALSSLVVLRLDSAASAVSASASKSAAEAIGLTTDPLCVRGRFVFMGVDVSPMLLVGC